MTQIDKAVTQANGEVIECGRDGFCAVVFRETMLGGRSETNIGDVMVQVRLRFIGSWGKGWDHVSVSLVDRCPTWEEMCFIKDLCFFENECVMQLHPPKEDWVDCHPFCLHLWKPTARGLEIPRPAKELVGGVGVEVNCE